MRMWTACCLLFSSALLAPAAMDVDGHLAALARQNIVWDSPSTNATGSMPLSGGELGLNVWVEGDDLLFYIGHPDSRMENQKLVKLGRVRLTLSPSPFQRPFRQELDLAESCIRIHADSVALKLWADAFAPVVHVEMESASARVASVAYESWRFTATPISNGLEWCYRHDPAKSDRPGKLKAQRVEALADLIPDPLTNLTMGGRIIASGLVADGVGEGTYMRTPYKAWKAKSVQPVTNLDLRVLLRVAQDDSVEAWRSELDKLERTPTDRAKTIAWWREFWGRSWIHISECRMPIAELKKDAETGNSESTNRKSAIEDRQSPAWQVGRNYQLFRYMLAANRTGKAPTLFNGGIFTFDNPLPNATAFDAAGPCPDERAWWGCHFMAQNQRWVYWPMVKAGDFDLLRVGLDFYRDRTALQEARSKHFFGVEGTPFCESLDLYGLQAACASGDGHMGCEHLMYHYTSALEFAFMMLEECRFTGREVAASLPVLMGVLKFYDNFYQQECRKLTGAPLDERGKLVIFPGNSCEMGVGCRNHADAVAGLRAIAAGLLQLRGTDRAWLESFAKRIPEIPVAEKNGHRYIALADSWQKIANPNEFPQLYAVFPFHIYGMGLPDLELARDTWRYGAFNPKVQKEAMCWKYGNIGVAELGLADEARDYAIKKFTWPNAAFTPRFPAFWVTYPFDAFPDMDHGGTAMVGLQEMLLQTPGDQLLLLPAWPQEWDVDFKLHAPRQTTVECSVRGGKVMKLVVTPESRRQDVRIIGPVAPAPKPVSQGRAAAASTTYARSPGYEADKAFDGDPDTRWSADAGTHDGWLEVDLGRECLLDRALLDETSYPNVAEFALERRVGEAWMEFARGTTIGSDLDLTFAPVPARRVRLHVLKIKDNPNPNFVASINEFQLFEKESP